MSAIRTATPSRRTVRAALVAGLVPAALALSAGPAHAIPWPGDPVPDDRPAVAWGWAGGADGPRWFAQRFGINLPPHLRGPVLEFMDH